MGPEEKAWEGDQEKLAKWSLSQDGLVTTCHISHDGKYVVSGSDMENALLVCNVEDGEQVAFIRDYHRSTIQSCRFDPVNQRIATVSSDMSIKFWDIIARATTVTIERAHNNAIADCCFSLDGHYLCTAGWDENIKLWDVRTGEFRSHGPITLDQGHIGIVGCCDFSKDGELYRMTVLWHQQREKLRSGCLPDSRLKRFLRAIKLLLLYNSN
ncbi:WD repeat-containing protein 88, partial [Ophiophagus hannah]